MSRTVARRATRFGVEGDVVEGFQLGAPFVESSPAHQFEAALRRRSLPVVGRRTRRALVLDHHRVRTEAAEV